ncbi:MAG: LytR C-terminal domain-containing protein [Microgenomates group bacterium]
MDGIEERSKPDFLRWGLVALVVLIGLGIVGGGIFVYQKTLKRKEEKTLIPTPTVSLPTPQLTESLEVSPSPTPKLNRADLKIKILNGSGVPGAAAKAAEFLEKLGWEGIKTGNADSYDYQKTIIKIKESKKNYLEMLDTDLASKYTLEEKTQTLAEDDKFDAIIILGKD